MSAELIAIIAAAVSLGGLVTVQIAGVRASMDRLADRFAGVEQRIARVEGMIDTLQSVLLADRRDADRGAA